MKTIVYKQEIEMEMSEHKIDRKALIMSVMGMITMLILSLAVKPVRPITISFLVLLFFLTLHLLLGFKTTVCPECKKELRWTGFTKSGMRSCCCKGTAYEKNQNTFYLLNSTKATGQFMLISRLPSFILSILVFISVDGRILEKLCPELNQYSYMDILMFILIVFLIFLSFYFFQIVNNRFVTVKINGKIKEKHI